MHSSQIELPAEYNFVRAQQMAFQMRIGYMGCEGYNAFQISMSVYMENGIALKMVGFYLFIFLSLETIFRKADLPYLDRI